MVSGLIFNAYKARASDIHLEPQEDGEVKVRLRIDGVMQLHETLEPSMGLQAISRIKIMSALNIAEKRLPQDGRIRLMVDKKLLVLRVSLVPTSFGERITMRIFSRDMIINLTLDMLDLSKEQGKKVKALVAQPNGIVISSGPTGSGKTTTMYCMLKELDSEKMNIFSVEHPVKYTIPGVSQISVQPHIGLTYGNTIRALMRQDPDVVMVGEIRDFETAQLVAEASLTGHLLLIQLHTNTATGSLTRLLDIGMEPFIIGETVKGIVNQRLVRKLCKHCRKPAKLPVKRMPASIAEFAQSIEDAEYYDTVGCDKCGLGYRGRAAIHEVLVMNDSLREAGVAKADTDRLTEIARAEGMTTLL